MKFILSLAIVFFTSLSFGYIPDHSVSKIKIGPWQGVKSTSSASFSTTSVTPVDVTNLTATLTTYGRPVRLQLINNAGGSGFVNIGGSSGSTDTGILYFVVGGSPGVVLSTNNLTAGLGVATNAVPCSAFSTVAEVIAGTHAFKVQVQTSATSNFAVTNCVLMAYEL